MKKILLFILILIFISNCFANGRKVVSIDEENGYDWEKFTFGVKLGYVMGFSTAIHACIENINFLKETVELIQKPKNVKNTTDLSTIEILDFLYIDISEYDLAGITMGQLVNGLNEFYKDYRNKHIPIYRALPLIDS